MFEKEAEGYGEKDLGGKYLSSMVAKDKLHAYKLGQYDGFIAGAEFGYNKANEEFKICEQNADNYYDKLQKAKKIIQEFLDLNYSEFTKTNAVFLHADKFLKE